MAENVIIGANGMVGRAIFKHLSDAVGTFRNNRVGEIPDRKYEYLDITNPSAVYFLLEQNKPKRVFIAAANAHVDYCEDKNTDRTNIDGVKSIINNCYRIGAQVIFFSSSYVFDGKSETPYKTDDETFPVNAYGRQKEKIEKFIIGYKDLKWLIVRTVGVFGEDGLGKNFVDQVRSEMKKTGSRVIVPSDQTMNPVWSMDLARTVIKLSSRFTNEIFHVAGDERMTKYEFAIKIAYKLGHPKPHDFVVGVKSDKLNQLALRPRNGCLDCGKLKTVAIKIPSFKKGLKSYLGK